MLQWTETTVAEGLCLRLFASPEALCAIQFAGAAPDEGRSDQNPVLIEACRQLRAYFGGSLSEFELPLSPEGTEFQKRVWREVARIPYGRTRTYAEIAEAVGDRNSVRAVGAANGANPIPIVIPCHRVIGSNGKLTGYAGGLGLKQRLLNLESGSLF